MRFGRGFPLSTQYTALSRVVPSNPLGGDAAMQLDAGTAALTIVAPTIPVVAAQQTGSHKFRHVQTPSFQDLGEVQRYLQRSFDEVAQAVNAVKAVQEGGTGLQSFEGKGVLQTTSATQLQLIPLAAGTLQSDGSTVSFAPAGSVTGAPNRAPSFLLMGG